MMAYTIITTPLWPAYTDAYTRGDYDWMIKTRNKMKTILLLSILGCFILVVLSQPIYHIWIGNKVNIPYTMTLLVALYVSAYCWMNFNGTLVVGIGKIQVETIIVIFGMLSHRYNLQQLTH
jgi:O-antigen/teichoic acid export membrane protein